MSIRDDLAELENQLGKGAVQRAYGSIIGYMSQLRSHFVARDGDRAVSALYQGCFDMTYFALFPPALKVRGLKLAIVFDYESFAFEVWLAARNRALHRQYWELLRDSGWSGHRLVEPATGIDAIVEREVAAASDVATPDLLTSRIEAAAQELLGDLVAFLDVHDAQAEGQGRVRPVPFVVSDPCPICEGQGTVEGQACRTCQGTGVEVFYHGTKADMRSGSLIEPGRLANFGEQERIANYVYMAGTLDAATWGAELALGEGRGRIYIVEPTGPIEDDPNLTDKRFPGNPTKSYRSLEPLRVTGEVTEWQGHSAEELKAMREGLERLKSEGADVIDD